MGTEREKKAWLYIDTYIEQYKPYKEHWNYEDGCVLIGCEDLFRISNNRKYFDFIQSYVDERITEDGKILVYESKEHAIDNILSGRILFLLHENTGLEKYKRAAMFLKEELMNQPRCACGSFWHKDRYPYQVWLDGLYMAQPFYMEFETKFHQKEGYADILEQFNVVREKLWNPDKGLYYHAWDEKKIQPWADLETGLSPNFWLRSEGWFLMALIDTIDVMSIEIYEKYDRLCTIFKEAIKGILRYQDGETGMFYQITDRADLKENYLETSGSAMIAYAILKGIRLGVLLDEKYADTGKKIMEGILDHNLVDQSGRLHLTGICKVAGLGPGTERNGSTEYYLSEPVTIDDPKGTGPLMMAFAEYREGSYGKD